MPEIRLIPATAAKSDSAVVETLKGLLEAAIHRRISTLDIKAVIDGENIKIRIETRE